MPNLIKNILNIKSFLLISIFIFAVFPTMSILLAKRIIPVGLILIITAFFCLMIKPKQVIKNILTLNKITSTKIMLLFAVWVVISAFFVFLFLENNFISMLFSIFLAIVLSFILPYFLSFVMATNFSTKFIIKFYTIILYTILCFGLIDFIIYYFKIPLLDTLYFVIIANARALKAGTLFLIPLHKLSNIPRVQSVFEEPSHFAWFICINIPFVLSICLSKYKVFKSKILNIIVKKTMILLAYISLLLTKSPINIIFAVIITIFYFMIKIKFKTKHIIKILLLLSCSCLLGFFIIQKVVNASIDDILFFRIKMVILNTRSFLDLIHTEASLATRLGYYGMMFDIFKKYPLFGCGWGNLGTYLYQEVQTTAIPLTEEIWVHFLKAKDKNISYCLSIFFRTIAETGVVGICILFAFLIKIKQYAKYLKEKSAFILKDFYFGIEQTILIYIILSFYDSNLYIEYFWFLFGTIAGLFFMQKKREVRKYADKNDI